MIPDMKIWSIVFVCVISSACSKSWDKFWELSVSAPSVTNVSPIFGASGDEVTITGSGFSSSTADISVYFAGVSAPVLSASGTSVKVQVPDTATTGEVRIISRGGEALALSSFAVERYVLYSCNNVATISIRPINNSTGALTTVTSAAPGGSTADIGSDSQGRYLYVPNGATGVHAFSINKSTGALATLPLSPYTFTPIGGDQSDKIIVDLADRFIYMTDVNSANFYRGVLNAATGLVSGYTAVTHGTTLQPQIHPGGGYIYVSQATNILAYSLPSSGAMVTVPGSPFATVQQPTSAVFTPDGKYLYVGRGIANDMMRFNVDTTTGALSNSTTMAGGISSARIAMRPDGKFLFASDMAGANIRAYPVDSAGDLGTPVTSVLSGTISRIAVTPNSRYFIAVDTTTGATHVAQFLASGALSPVAGSPFSNIVNIGSIHIARVRQ